MATGRLGASDLGATTNTSVYTVPTSKVATFTVSICNRNAAAVTFRLGLCSTATPSGGEYIEYDSVIPGNSAIERTGIVLDAGKILVSYASTTGVSVVAWGYEESA